MRAPYSPPPLVSIPHIAAAASCGTPLENTNPPTTSRVPVTMQKKRNLAHLPMARPSIAISSCMHSSRALTNHTSMGSAVVLQMDWMMRDVMQTGGRCLPSAAGNFNYRQNVDSSAQSSGLPRCLSLNHGRGRFRSRPGFEPCR